MQLKPYEKFEIRAEAFRIMTGHIAPGKGASPLAVGVTLQARTAAYREWLVTHYEVTQAMFSAFQQLIEREGEDL